MNNASMLKVNHALMLECFRTPTKQMLYTLGEKLKGYGYKSLGQDWRWLYAPGTIPVLMVAHVDTVHAGMPTDIYYDKKLDCLWAKTGIGADDRAGVSGVLHLLEAGYRPHVLFTDEEETGGGGATDAAEMLEAPDVHLMVQLDRRGKNDACYYSCSNGQCEKWVTKHGFKTACGSFTDISILMPAWKIAGVNLSIGYYDAHTSGEYLVLNEWQKTLERVGEMLKSPPENIFKYHRESYKSICGWRGGSQFRNDDLYNDWGSRVVRDYEKLPAHYQDKSQVDTKDDYDAIMADSEYECCESCDDLVVNYQMTDWHDKRICLDCYKAACTTVIDYGWLD